MKKILIKLGSQYLSVLNASTHYDHRDLDNIQSMKHDYHNPGEFHKHTSMFSINNNPNAVEEAIQFFKKEIEILSKPTVDKSKVFNHSCFNISFTKKAELALSFANTDGLDEMIKLMQAYSNLCCQYTRDYKAMCAKRDDLKIKRLKVKEENVGRFHFSRFDNGKRFAHFNVCKSVHNRSECINCGVIAGDLKVDFLHIGNKGYICPFCLNKFHKEMVSKNPEFDNLQKEYDEAFVVEGVYRGIKK